jgi:hypothetical protein
VHVPGDLDALRADIETYSGLLGIRLPGLFTAYAKVLQMKELEPRTMTRVPERHAFMRRGFLASQLEGVAALLLHSPFIA